MKSTDSLIRFGQRLPKLTKFLLTWGSRGWLMICSEEQRRNPHWLLRKMLRDHYVRVPLKTTLANGWQLIVPWCDQVGDEIASGDSYEAESFTVLDHLLKPGMVVFDVGAHAGVYTLHAAERVGTSGQVHSFEAEGTLANWLSTSLKLNAIENVQVNATVLGETEGEVRFYKASDASVNSLVEPRDIYGFEIIRLPSTTLAGYLQRHNISHIDLVKMDVEGAELTVLNTIRDLLSSDQRPILIIEFAESRASLADLADFLIECGYHLYRIASDHIVQFDAGDLPEPAADAPNEAFNALAVSPGFDLGSLPLPLREAAQ